jgi:hypothetical protein
VARGPRKPLEPKSEANRPIEVGEAHPLVIATMIGAWTMRMLSISLCFLAQDNCTAACSPTNPVSVSDSVVCHDVHTACVFSSYCIANCSGWNVSTDCSSVAAAAGAGDHGCYGTATNDSVPSTPSAVPPLLEILLPTQRVFQRASVLADSPVG